MDHTILLTKQKSISDPGDFQDQAKNISNSKFESVRHLALNLARALARNNTASKSMIKSKSTSKKKAGRKDNTLLNL
ncbi:hypothetical protein, partial [Desulfobacter sp.]